MDANRTKSLNSLYKTSYTWATDFIRDFKAVRRPYVNDQIVRGISGPAAIGVGALFLAAGYNESFHSIITSAAGGLLTFGGLAVTGSIILERVEDRFNNLAELRRGGFTRIEPRILPKTEYSVRPKNRLDYLVERATERAAKVALRNGDANEALNLSKVARNDQVLKSS